MCVGVCANRLRDQGTKGPPAVAAGSPLSEITAAGLDGEWMEWLHRILCDGRKQLLPLPSSVHLRTIHTSFQHAAVSPETHKDKDKQGLGDGKKQLLEQILQLVLSEGTVTPVDRITLLTLCQNMPPSSSSTPGSQWL